MSASFRTLIAGLLLAMIVITITAGSTAEALGSQVLLAAVVLFAHSWIIAVGERAYVLHGGAYIRRAPLGPRLVGSRRSLLSQTLLLSVLVGASALDWKMGAVVAAIVIVLSLEILRTIAPYLLVAALPIYGLATMDEFHTLADLVTTAQSWVVALTTVGIWALVLCGPILRTDVSGDLPVPAKLVAFAAGLPGYVLAAFVVQRVAFLASFGTLFATMIVLLGGGVIQTFIASLLGRSAGIADRNPLAMPRVDARAVGHALMPMLAPILAGFALVAIDFGKLAVPGPSMAGLPAVSWMGALAIATLIPAVPAAVMVGGALDRLDGRTNSSFVRTLSAAALVVWGMAAPAAILGLYGAGGLAGRMAGAMGFEVVAPLSAAHSDQAGLVLGGVPMTGMLISCTLMMFASALLASRYVLRAKAAGGGIGWVILILQLLLQAALTSWAVPRFGPVAAPLSAAGAASLLWAADLAGAARRAAPEPVPA